MRSIVPARAAVLALLVAAGLAAGGCRSGARSSGGSETPSPEALPAVSNVMPGDVLHGRLAGPKSCQAFTFEGTEYALLDVLISSETDGQPAPRLSITDPDGRVFDMAQILSPASGPAQGGQGIILRRSGTYRVTVCAAEGCGETCYAFAHDVRLSTQADRTYDLSPRRRDTLAFVAPKGSRCVVSVAPSNTCGVRARILAVKDPANGRALAPEAQLEGAPDPRIASGRGNEARLDFIAPRAGRYLVVMTAEEGTSGLVTAHVSVRPPERRNLDLYFDAPVPAATPTSAVAAR